MDIYIYTLYFAHLYYSANQTLSTMVFLFYLVTLYFIQTLLCYLSPISPSYFGINTLDLCQVWENNGRELRRTPDIKSRPTKIRKGLQPQLIMSCAPFRLVSQDFGTKIYGEVRRCDSGSRRWSRSCSWSWTVREVFESKSYLIFKLR